LDEVAGGDNTGRISAAIGDARAVTAGWSRFSAPTDGFRSDAAATPRGSGRPFAKFASTRAVGPYQEVEMKIGRMTQVGDEMAA
jgi:hypothetical protein